MTPTPPLPPCYSFLRLFWFKVRYLQISHTPLLEQAALTFTLCQDDDVEEAKKKAIPKNMDKNTSSAVNMWKQWSAHRHQVCASYSDWSTHLIIAAPSELNYWLSKLNFVLEVRKADGEHYPTDILHVTCSDLQQFKRPDLKSTSSRIPLQDFSVPLMES